MCVSVYIHECVCVCVHALFVHWSLSFAISNCDGVVVPEIVPNDIKLYMYIHVCVCVCMLFVDICVNCFR